MAESVEIRIYQGLHPSQGFRLLAPSSEGAPGFLTFGARVTAAEGYASGQIVCTGTASELALSPGQRVQIIGVSDGLSVGASARRVVLWDGLISQIVPDADRGGGSSAPTFTAQLLGVWREAARRVSFKRYANTGGDDIASVFSDVFTRFVATGALAYLTVIATDTGSTTWEAIDAFGVSAREAIGRMNLDTSRIFTGGDVDFIPLSSPSAYSGAPRLFLRPARSTSIAASHTVIVPDVRVRSYRATQEETGKVSVLRILGGTAKYPNLLAAAVDGNTSFETPQIPGASAGSNLILNPSFEIGNGNTNWTFTGGASSRQQSDEGIPPYEGNRYLLLDHLAEKATQTQNPPAILLVPGNKYTLRAFVRRIINANSATASMRLVWLDGGGTVLQTDAIAVSPSSVAYEQHTVSGICPATATGFRVEFELTANTGTGSQDGLIFDALSLFDASVASQTGWRIERTGTAQVVQLDWDSDTQSWHGGRSVFVDTTGANTGANQVILLPLTGALSGAATGGTFTVAGVAPLKCGFVVRRRADSLASVALVVELVEYKSDGTIAATTSTSTTLTGTNWTVIPHSKSPAANAASATLRLRIQSDAKIYIDGAFAFAQDAPIIKTGALSGTLAGSSDLFIEADRYEVTRRALDVFAPASEVGLAATALGEVWDSVSVPGVTADADALLFAESFYPGSLTTDWRIEVESVGLADTGDSVASCLACAMPGQSLRLTSGGQSIADGQSVRGEPLYTGTETITERTIRYEGGLLSVSVSAGVPPIDAEEAFLKAAALRARQAGG